MTELLQENSLKSSYLKALKILIPLLLAISSAYAQEIPVNLNAEHLKFDQETNRILASGSVEAKFLDIEIRSDDLIIDTNTNIATAEGHVYIKRSGYEARCEKLTYDIKRDEAYGENFKAGLALGETKNKIFVTLKTLKDSANLKTGSNAGMTTCDLGSPHYSASAKSFYYIPDDKIVGANVTMYIGSVPVMWLPFYVYDLAKRRVSLVMPVVGNNEIEGNFVKAELEYYLNENNSGSVYIDLMKKKGLGIGIEQDYKIGPKQSGDFYLYHVNEEDTGLSDWVTKLKHEIKIGDYGKLSLSNSYSGIYIVPSGRLDKTFSNIAYAYKKDDKKIFNASVDSLTDRAAFFSDNNLNLSGKLDSYNSSYKYNSRGSLVSPNWRNISQNISHSQKLFGDSSDLSFSANYFQLSTAEGFPYSERIDPSLALSFRGPFYLIKISENTYINPNKDASFTDNTEYIEKLPEATLSLNPMDLKLFSFVPEFGYARYHESRYISQIKAQRNFVSNMLKGSFSANKNLNMPLGSTLSLLFGVEQYHYDPGDERYLQRENYSLKTELGGFFRNQANYDKYSGGGNSPFFFDSKGSYSNTLRDKITFYKGDAHQFNIEGGYNYLTKKYFDLLLDLNSKPADQLNVSMKSGYDIENNKWRNLVSLLTFIPFLGFHDNLSNTYDLNAGKTVLASNLLDFEIGNTWASKWKVRLGHTYDVASNYFVLQEASIVKDLHCWEAKYTWSQFRKEFRITFTLKAFPEQPIGYASGSRGFFLEGINQETPVRY